MKDLDQFNEECLYVHNEYIIFWRGYLHYELLRLRKFHKVPPLDYDKDLAIDAEKYANTIAVRKSARSSTSEDPKDIGENISQSTKDFVNYIYSGYMMISRKHILIIIKYRSRRHCSMVFRDPRLQIFPRRADIQETDW